ncbi:hypothetical protein [Nocardia fusca]|uniref:hypothetical protein n=1 Tax=Nocardia fusca TaxID=941183 RepID=UPI0007A76378|nr:hypothetical protein [Nocardia fusca]
MKIRLTGTPTELRAATALLGEVFELREVSAPYPNRGTSTLHRLYIDVGIPTAPKESAGPGN